MKVIRFFKMFKRNGSAEYDGVYNMYNGKDDIEKLGLLYTWNYNKTVSFLSGNCSKVEGTMGELWYPPRSKPTIKLFASDLCRYYCSFKLSIQKFKFQLLIKLLKFFFPCLLFGGRTSYNYYCSSIELMKSDKYIKHGVEGDKYSGSEKIFDNGTIYPEMKCFIPEDIQQPSGVRNVSLCKYETLSNNNINNIIIYFLKY